MENETIASEVVAEVPATDVTAECELNKEQAEMADKPEEKETPEEEKKESPEVEKKEDDEKMKAEYEAMKAEMTAKLEAMTAEKADVESKLQAANAQLAEANNVIKAHRITELKARLVGSVMEEEEFDGKAEKLLTLDAEVIDLMIRGRKSEAPAGGKLRMVASDQNPPAVKLY